MTQQLSITMARNYKMKHKGPKKRPLQCLIDLKFVSIMYVAVALSIVNWQEQIVTPKIHPFSSNLAMATQIERKTSLQWLVDYFHWDRYELAYSLEIKPCYYMIFSPTVWSQHWWDFLHQS